MARTCDLCAPVSARFDHAVFLIIRLPEPRPHAQAPDLKTTLNSGFRLSSGRRDLTAKFVIDRIRAGRLLSGIVESRTTTVMARLGRAVGFNTMKMAIARSSRAMTVLTRVRSRTGVRQCDEPESSHAYAIDPCFDRGHSERLRHE
jgi:hypothetical protein